MANHADITKGPTITDWRDLIVDDATLANVSVTVQNKSTHKIFVFFGGAAAPANDHEGVVLDYGDAVTATAAHIWVRGEMGFRVGLIENV